MQGGWDFPTTEAYFMPEGLFDHSTMSGGTHKKAHSVVPGQILGRFFEPNYAISNQNWDSPNFKLKKNQI